MVVKCDTGAHTGMCEEQRTCKDRNFAILQKAEMMMWDGLARVGVNVEQPAFLARIDAVRRESCRATKFFVQPMVTNE